MQDGDHAKVKILIVDDKPANIVSLEAILDNADYHLVTATSGVEALKLLLDHDFAVILLDVMMPEMDGFDVARLVRQRSRAAMTPIIFLTAIATDFRYLQAGYAVGAVDYLQKPLDPAIVKAKVAVFAELHRRAERIKQQEAQLREIQRAEQERRIAEVQRAGERHYRELAEALPQIIFTADPDGNVTYFNTRWFDYTGLGPEDGLTQAARRRVIHPDDLATYDSSWENALASASSTEVEMRLREARSGAYRWHLCRARVERNGDGDPVGWLGTLTDIHEQKRAERSQRFLADSTTLMASSYNYEETLARLAGAVVDGFADYCLVDLLLPGTPFRRIVRARTGAGDPDLWLADACTRDEAYRLGARSLKYGPVLLSPADDAIAVPAGAGPSPDFKPTSLVSAPVVLRGDVVGAITWLGLSGRCRLDRADFDLAVETSRHVALALENILLYREAQETNRRKDEFLAILSHELRTPLNAVLGWTELTKLETVDQKVVESLGVIERNAKSLSQLVADLLDVSRIITGKLELSRVPVELRSFLTDVIATVQPLADEKRIELSLQLPTRGSIMQGDVDRLRQVMWNLLVNAIKFTPDGGRVQLTMLCTPTKVRITVEDSGPGIAPELLPYVFDRFRQADSSSTRKHGGLGLGLAIVRHIVELHGGEVRARSSGAGQGAQFTVELPILDQDERRTVPASAPPDRGALCGLEGTTVLLVDDDPSSRMLAATFLKHSGATVRTAGSVREAMNSVHQDVPDVVLTDIGMPEEDGFVLLSNLRRFQSETGRAIRMAALTAYASNQDAERALEAGFEVYLTKPINATELVAAIGRLRGPTLGAEIIN
jgi:PAS domain S-box-containing protein